MGEGMISCYNKNIRVCINKKIMGRDLLDLTQFIGLIIFVIELNVAIKVARIGSVSNYFKIFWIYPLVGSLICFFLLLAHFKLVSRDFSFITNAISLLFHYSFISYAFYIVNSKEKMFKLIAMLLFIVIAVAVCVDIVYRNNTSFSIANGALFFYSIFFITKYLQTNDILHLSKLPFFFICAGVLIGTALIIPVAFMVKYLREIKTPGNTIYYFLCISSVGYIIINLFFIKALLVARKNSLDIEQKENIVLNN
jgi:hypothetical protein